MQWTGLTYELRYTADPTDDDEWTDWKTATSGETVAKLTMGTEYTFEVRGRGMSRAGVGDLHGPSASTMEMMPGPTPTRHSLRSRRCSSRCSSWAAARICSGAGSRAA